MSDHVCSKEQEIKDLKEQISKIQSTHASDHDLLIELTQFVKINIDILKTQLGDIAKEIKKTVAEPGDRWEKVKLVIITTAIVSVVNLIMANVLGG